MPEMKEQIAQQPTYRRSRSAKKDHTVYYPADENPYTTDEPIEEDERFYSVCQPSSVVDRRKIPLSAVQNRTTIMRVTRHAGASITPRASLQAQQPQQQAKQKPVRQAKKRFHWLFYVGCGAMASLALWIVGSAAVSLAQAEHDNLTYGTPRTYQIDANIDHGLTSHFTVENLDGHIIIFETQISNLASTKVYEGPTFSGNDADNLVATISFQVLTKSGLPDMVIKVGNGRYVLINTGTAFRPTTPSDKIDQEVN